MPKTRRYRYIKKQFLTAEEHNLLDHVRDEWMNNMYERCENGIDRNAFQKGIYWFYKEVLHLRKPRIIYCSYWSSAVFIIVFYKLLQRIKIDLIGVPLKGTIETHLDREMWSPIGRTVEASVGANVASLIMERIGNVLTRNFWTNAAETIRDNDAAAFSFAEYTFNDYTRDMDWSNLEYFANCEYLQKLGIINNDIFEKYKNLVKAGAFNCYMYGKLVVAIEPPIYMDKKDNFL